MEEIIKKREVPPLPQNILIKYGNTKFSTNENTEIKDLSDTGVKDIVEKIRNGLCESLYLNPNEDGESLTRIIWTLMMRLPLKPVMDSLFSLWRVPCKTENWRQNVWSGMHIPVSHILAWTG